MGGVNHGEHKAHREFMLELVSLRSLRLSVDRGDQSTPGICVDCGGMLK